MRIVSLLPSATEIVCLLGLADTLVGISHACDYPPAVVADLPRLTRSSIQDTLSASEIDRVVSARLRHGESLYLLDENALAALQPDLVITQALCDVCAVSYADVCAIATRISSNPQVVSLAPSHINGIFTDIETIATAVGKAERGERLKMRLQARLERVRTAIASHPRRSVVALEWLDPPFAAGHWVPEMMAAAGGDELLGRAGERSFRLTWEQVIASQPEVIMLIPCGYSAAAAWREWNALPRPSGWGDIPAVRSACVYALDANSYCSRPAPRIVEGIETVARLFHPTAFAGK